MSDLIEIEGAFCAKVTEALKVQSSDLRKEARILRAFREASEAQQSEIERLKLINFDHELNFSAAKVEIDQLREALRGVFPYIVQSISCNGDKCRLPVCFSCNYEDDDTRAAIEKAKEAILKAYKVLGGKHD